MQKRRRDDLPLVAIVGPTASGKTALAIRLAKQFDGEVICADSRTVYRGLDIGTAKPTSEERSTVPHWGVDLVDPSERFTVVDFQQYAYKKIDEIRMRGRIPFIVGGTGLYVDAVMYHFLFPSVDAASRSLRSQLERQDIEKLHQYCHKNNIKLPENYKNKRYVINTIVRNEHKYNREQFLEPNSFIVGITTEKHVLRKRIHDRADTIISASTIAETKNVARKYGWANEAMTGNAYPLIRRYLAGTLTAEELKEKFEIADWRLAKRQLTWLRRNKEIHWYSPEEAYTNCARWLESMNKS